MVQHMVGFSAPVFPRSAYIPAPLRHGLVRSDPRDVPRIIALSRASYRKMMQNLWWAAGYNIVAIPLAAGVLASRGILLPPTLAAVLMSASTVIVAINAQLLRRAKL